MTFYKSENVTGTSFKRSYKVEIENPAEANPVVIFHEENVVLLSDGTKIRRPTGTISKEFIDPNATIDLVDPVSLEPLGVTMTHGQLYATMVSLYIAIANERDAALAETNI